MNSPQEEQRNPEADKWNHIQSLEAILFAAGDPVSCSILQDLLAVEADELNHLLNFMAKTYASEQHGIELRRLGDSVALATKPAAKVVLEKFFARPAKVLHLSQAAYETLAVVAYNEPVTRAQLDQVRGVNSDGALNRLVEKGLVEMTGTLDLPGRPAVFRTTELFLRLYGIQSLAELEPMDMLMYDTVQDFEQSYRKTQDLALKHDDSNDDDPLESINISDVSQDASHAEEL
ncbi:MAG: SMC-Scp complex subunit ScpB [Clostridiaceae bacterium]|nr:SMC-Scp complex subunit ScpB [Clostridiaceae bacterium]